MDKLIKLLSLEALKGSRLKICLVSWGVIGVLVAIGVMPQALGQLIVALGTPFAAYFLVEHFEKK